MAGRQVGRLGQCLGPEPAGWQELRTRARAGGAEGRSMVLEQLEGRWGEVAVVRKGRSGV